MTRCAKVGTRHLCTTAACVLSILVGCQPQRVKVAKYNKQVNSIGVTMIQLPSGTFQMGNPEFRKPVHEVRVSSFWISETEVTNRQYEQLVPKHVRAKESMGDDSPVCGISRDDAEAFVRTLSKKEKKAYRLPTDAEWEYAARGGLVGKDFPWGDQDSEKFMNTGLAPNAPKVATRVKSFPPNAFGLYDMVGNASEWILDTDLEFPASVEASIEVDPVHTEDRRLWLTRGGSFSNWYPFVWFANPQAPSKDRSFFFDCGMRLVLVQDHGRMSSHLSIERR